MKRKVFVIMLLLICIVSVSGCGSKKDSLTRTITCTMANTTSGLEMDSTLNYYFEKGTFKKAGVQIDLKFSTESYYDKIKTGMDSQFSSYDNYSISKTSDGATIKFEAGIDKINEYSGTSYTEDDMKITKASEFDDFVEEIESSGFKCK